MPRVAVLTDTSSDLNEAQAAAFGIHLLTLNVSFGGQEWPDTHMSEDGTLSTEQMFQAMRAGADIPTLVMPTLQQYLGCVEELLRTHDHVLALHTSPFLGRVFAFAFQATAHLEGRVTVFNSGSTSGGLALQAIRAAALLQSGEALPDVIQVLRAAQREQTLRICVTTLEYLRRGHLISGIDELVGTVQNMKPIFEVAAGRLVAAAHPRGSEAARQEMLRALGEYAQAHPDSRIIFMHNGESEALAELQAESQRLGLAEIASLPLGTVMSSFVGAEAFGFVAEPNVPCPNDSSD